MSTDASQRPRSLRPSGLILLAIAEGIKRASTQNVTHPFDIAEVILAALGRGGFRVVKKSSKERT